MSRRRDLPGLNDESSATLGEVREHLRRWRCETLEAVDLLHAHRARVDESIDRLENPKAVIEYLDAFVDLFTRIAAELARIDAALEAGIQPDLASALRQIASNASIEQTRCLMFRDKVINKPLPYEQVRPLLNQISNDTRDQLLDFRDLDIAASRLDALHGVRAGAKDDEHVFDRRSLFTRFLPRKE